MNRVAQAIAKTDVILASPGSRSIESVSDIFRSDVKRVSGQSFSQINAEKRQTKDLEKLQAATGGQRVSIKVNFGSTKRCSPAHRPLAHGSATLVRPGEHVPQDFGSEYLVRSNAEVFRAMTGVYLLSWFEAMPEGQASKAYVDQLKSQVESAQEAMRVLAFAGADDEVEAAAKNLDNETRKLQVEERAHYDRASMKHMLAPVPKDNTARVISAIRSVNGVNHNGKVSIPSELKKPGEHLAARQTPKELRQITTDKNGKITGSPSAQRIVVGGNRVLAEAVENTEEEKNADKKESAPIKKSNSLALDKLIAEKDAIATLQAEVDRLEAEKNAGEDGLWHVEQKVGERPAHRQQRLDRLKKELAGKKTRLAQKMEAVSFQVRQTGILVITDSSSKKVGTRTCKRHEGRLNCKCHREVLVDKARGITKRAK